MKFYENNLSKILLGFVITMTLSVPFVYAESGFVDMNGNTYEITFATIDISVLGFDTDLDFVSLIVMTSAPSNGVLSITLERTFLDSISAGEDEPFFVLVDGDIAVFNEIVTTPHHRVLSINVPMGAEEVEIIGSEFGSVLSTDTPVDESESTEMMETTDTEMMETTDTEMMETESTEMMETTDTEMTESESTEMTNETSTTCGPGTILKDDICVLEPVAEIDEPAPSQPSTVSPRESNTLFFYGSTIAFIIAGAIGGVFGLIYKISKRKKN